jgi:hypothetical protein
VLLNVALTCAMARATLRRIFLRTTLLTQRLLQVDDATNSSAFP